MTPPEAGRERCWRCDMDLNVDGFGAIPHDLEDCVRALGYAVRRLGGVPLEVNVSRIELGTVAPTSPPPLSPDTETASRDKAT